MSIPVICDDKKQITEMNYKNTYLRNEPSKLGYFNVIFHCPCGCGEEYRALVPTYEKYIETEKFKRGIKSDYEVMKKK